MCQLFEAVKIQDGIAQNVSFHNMRINRTRRELFGRGDEIDIAASISVPAGSIRGTHKCRIVYGGPGIDSVEFIPYQMRSITNIKAVHDDEIEYFYKYCDRGSINRLLALRGGCDDILIVRRGMITDTSFSNVAFHDGHRWITPSTYLLSGTKRMMLLRNGTIIEKEIGLSDLSMYPRMAFINAMIDLGELIIDINNIV